MNKNEDGIFNSKINNSTLTIREIILSLLKVIAFEVSIEMTSLKIIELLSC